MSFVQIIAAQGNSSSSSVPVSITLTAGNFVFANGKVNSFAAGVATISDTLGNVWVSVPNYNNRATGLSNVFTGWSVFYCLNCKGGATTVTFTSPGSVFCNLAVIEYTDKIIGFDNAVSTVNAASGTTFDSTAANMTYAN